MARASTPFGRWVILLLSLLDLFFLGTYSEAM